MIGVIGVSGAALAALASVATGGASSAEVQLQSSAVTPRRAFFDSERGVRISFRLDAPEPVDLTVRIRGGGREVRRFFLFDVAPGSLQAVVWDGITGLGKAAPDGRYRALVKPAGAAPLPAGRFVLHGHIFPVRGKHGTRGSIGEFGAPRSGGRVHEGFDVVAACGTPMVAVRAGRVTHRGYDPVLYGNFVEIKGRLERRSYFYSHLPKPANPERGEEVKTGERIGRVGMTGNARTIGCHLHFELHRHGNPIDPEPDLRRWDRYS